MNKTPEINQDSRSQVINVAEGLISALEQAGVDEQIAAAASIYLAAHLNAATPHKNRDVIEAFRSTFVAARKRWRESQN